MIDNTLLSVSYFYTVIICDDGSDIFEVISMVAWVVCIAPKQWNKNSDYNKSGNEITKSNTTKENEQRILLFYKKTTHLKNNMF